MTAFVVFWMMIAIIILFAVSLFCKLIHACASALMESAVYVGIGILVAAGVMLVAYLLANLVNLLFSGDLLGNLWELVLTIGGLIIGLAIAGALFGGLFVAVMTPLLYIAGFIGYALFYAVGFTLLGSEWLYGKCDAGCMRLIGGVVARLTPDSE